MFEKYFGLDENPFNLTPDPKYLYYSQIHKEALSHLKYGIDERKGFILLTGEVGAGKTTMCRLLLTMLPDTVKTSLILNPSLSDIELLQTINQEFGINYSHTSKKALLDELNGFLLNVSAKGENAVLIIDECQNLSPEVLEQIRMLSNLETEKKKLLQIVLIGQPELKTMLATPSLRQINDRITVRYHMGLLNKSDTRDYIKHRLIISGSHGEISFTSGAINKIFEFSGGLPRRINAACERSLLTAFTKGTGSINGSIARKAIKEITGEYSTYPYLKNAFALVLLIAIIGGLVFFLRPEILITSDKKAEPLTSEKQKISENKTSDLNNPVKQEWVIEDYKTAIERLKMLPGMSSKNSILNLHPPIDFLNYISSPFIASVWGGYCIIENINNGSVTINSGSTSNISYPYKNFKQIYQGHTVLVYEKNPVKETLGLSSTGNTVTTIQEKLLNIGYLSIKPNGIYGIETADGVRKLQDVCGLNKDGIAGSETIALINILGGNNR